MEKGDKTAIWAIVIGLGAAISGVAAAFAYPELAPTVWRGLFWSGLLFVLFGALALLDLHGLGGLQRPLRIVVPTAAVLVFVCVVGWSYTGASESGLYARFVFPNPPQYWLSGNVRARYTFSNLTEKDALISDLALTEIQTNSSLYNPYGGLGMCGQGRMVGLRMIDQFNTPGTAPIKVTDGGDIISTHLMTGESVNGEGYSKETMNIEKYRSVSVVGDYSLYAENWKEHNTVVICPSLIIRDAVLGDRMYVCPGMLVYRFPASEMTNVRALAPKDVISDVVEPKENAVGEIFAWKDAAFSLAPARFTASCASGPL